MRNSVVMIAYYFPPEGTAGVYRPLRFVRQLSKMGWLTTVISADPYRYVRYDYDLLASVPRETEIIQVRGRDLWQAVQAWRGGRMQEKPSGASGETRKQVSAGHRHSFRSYIRKAVRAAEAWYYYPDMAKAWIQPAVEEVVKVCERKRPQVIWATAGPVSAWLIAQRASERTGVPYVLDLRDPHGLGYYESELRWPVWVKRLNQRTMHRLFEGAQAVVFLFDSSAECYWHAYRGALDATKIHIIPNGYEGEIEKFNPSSEKKCVFLYTGTLSTYHYETLLQALQSFMETDPTQVRLLHFLFVGEGMEVLAKQAAALGLSDIIHTAGPSPQSEIPRLQREAHALLILGRRRDDKGHELLAGAKLFGYLKTGRPIVGILPQDETRKILSHIGVSTVADSDSLSEIIAVLRQVLTAWSEGTLSSLVPDRAACTAYSAERQTAALVRALQGGPALEPFIPGMVEISPDRQGEALCEGSN